MIQLLHTEIDVVPGRRPQRQALPEGMVGLGTAVLRITNATERENAYTVRLRCENPYWQDSWFRINAMPPAVGEGASSKPDQQGPKDQWVKVYVSNGASRDVLLSFMAPQRSDSRAGVYEVSIVVETHVQEGQGAAKGDRITEIKGTVIIRPYYEWQIEFQPEDRKVKRFFRRSAAYEVIIHNKGNDWLYCDLKLPRPKDVLLENFSQRLAVPPPEPGKDSSRSVPIRARTKHKAFRGAPKVDELPLTFHRVDAPTVPPLPEEAIAGVSSAGLGAPVVSSETSEIQTPEYPPTLTYCPPIPATLTDFIQSLARNALAISMLFLGLVAMLHISYLMYTHWKFKMGSLMPTSLTYENGDRVEFRGPLLAGARVNFYKQKEDKDSWYSKFMVTTLLKGKEHFFVETKDLKGLRDVKVFVEVERVAFIPYLNALMPRSKRFEIEFGIVIDPSKKPEAMMSPRAVPGKPFTIEGTGFGSEPGKVMFDNLPADQIVSWSDTQIVAVVPADVAQETIIVAINAKGEEVARATKAGGAPPKPPGPEPKKNAAPLPIPGYGSACRFDWASVAKEIDENQHFDMPAALALKAYALVETNQVTKARALLKDARTSAGLKTGEDTYKVLAEALESDAKIQQLGNKVVDYSVILSAETRLREFDAGTPSDLSDRHLVAADAGFKTAALFGRAVAFPALVYVDFAIRKNMKSNAREALKMLTDVPEELTEEDEKLGMAGLRSRL